MESADWLKSKMTRPEWTQVDHSNLCVGWGTEKDGTKYWIVQNTWGQDWGMEGFMQYKRGEDVGGMESIAVRADPVILRREASGHLKIVKPDYHGNHKKKSGSKGGSKGNGTLKRDDNRKHKFKEMD